LTGGYLTFKDVKVTPRFDSANLTALEMKRFIKAFLLYELLCKTERAGHHPDKLPHRREISKAEFEAVACVHSYIGSLYGALFAQCTDAWLPSTSTGTSPETGLLFPDTFYFEANTHASEVGFRASAHICEALDYVARFSTLGLPHLINFLRYDMAKLDERESLRVQLQQVWEDNFSYIFWERHTTIELLVKTKRHYKNDCDSLMYKKLGLETQNAYHSSSHVNELRYKISQQRAWVFFDDSRFYSEETSERPNFPSARFLADEPGKQASIEASVRAWFRNSDKERALRQTQGWHDERAKVDK
jgi:hypothetical protein